MTPTIKCLLILSIIPVTLLQGQISHIPSDRLMGRIADDSTGGILSGVHIFNESRRTGTVSDQQGMFRITAHQGDTLIISSLGYLGKVVIVNPAMFGQIQRIDLTARLYEIEAVSVTAYRDYEEFKKQFLALDLPDRERLMLRDKLRQLSQKEAMEAVEEGKVRDALSQQPGREPINGFTILWREDKQRLNYAKVLKQEEKQRIIDKKYNREIIYKITRLPEDELTDFMGFCNFSTEYLLNASEYEILVKIEEKFREYKAIKTKGDLIVPGLFLFPERTPDPFLA